MPRDLDRPRIGISRCLLGDEVRYDGGHKREDSLVADIGRIVEWVPVCPEVEVGMGVPREAIQLVGSADDLRKGHTRVRLVGVHSGEDWTVRMEEWARERLSTLAALRLSGFVLKSRSPSCGPRDVPVVVRAVEAGLQTRLDGRSETSEVSGRGLFAEALFEAMPDLPIEDEERLRDPIARRRFLDRVFAYQRSTWT